MNHFESEYIYTKRSIDNLFRVVGFVFIFALLITAVAIGQNYKKLSPKKQNKPNTITFTAFQDSQDMLRYLNLNRAKTSPNVELRTTAATGDSQASAPEYSPTNVQVPGIDEPDIVKTDGKNIFFSKQPQVYQVMQDRFEPLIEPEIYPVPNLPTPKIQIVDAYPPTELKVDSQIDLSGELLLEKDTLVVSDGKNLTGFNVSDRQNPIQVWKLKFDQAQIETLRLKDGYIYAVVKKGVNFQKPCPIPLLDSDQTEISVSCSQIYHPSVPAETDTTYTAVKINPETGGAEQTISFVGSSLNTVVFMSQKALYITSQTEVGIEQLQLEFLSTDGADILPQSYLKPIATLAQLDLSSQAKAVEVSQILNQYRSGLDQNQALTFDNTYQNRFQKFISARMRQLQTTNIARIDLAKLELTASTQVPGHLLNQFSLDEEKEILRVATTVGGIGLGEQSANDVYTLDKNLKIVGGLTGLGTDERIYAARFIKDRAYLVTFRQTDPFYIIDLSDPKNPKKAGELKIPGYSSYLHPLSDKLILGVGKQNQFVKLSLFDVSSSTPVELDNFITDTYWSEVLDNHRAFSFDPRGDSFFLPTSSGGLIFSIQNNSLTLNQAVLADNIKRAIYIDKYLYLIDEKEITVLDKENWETVIQLDLN